MSDWIGRNGYLSTEEKTINAQYILNYLTTKGWTKNAICGMLGNLETESTINPQLWEVPHTGDTSYGYGLVQWTPMTKMMNWCNVNGKDYTQMDSQLERIIWEVTNGDQWTNIYGMTFEEFTQSTDSAYNLAMMFIKAYERPLVPNQPIRGTQAENWFNTLTGGGSGGGGTGNQCKLIYPYWFSSNIKISYTVNKFNLLTSHGNVVRIENITNKRKYYVNKSSIKLI